MASPTIVASTATTSHPAAPSFDLQVPAHQAGDIILMHVVNDDNDGLPGWSEGWNVVPGATVDTTNGTHSELRYLEATGSNHTCTVTYPADPGQMWAAAVTLRDFDAANPFAGVKYSEQMAAETFTPTSNGTTICSFIGVYGPQTGVDYSTGPGAGWTTQEGGSHTSNWAHGGLATLQQTTAAEVTTAWDAAGYDDVQYFVAVKGPVDDQTAPTCAIDAIHGAGAAESITDSAGYNAGTDTLTVTGTAADVGGSGVASVSVRVDGGAWQLATGTTTWTIDLDVPTHFGTLADSHTVEARSTDGAGLQSVVAVETVYYSPSGVWVFGAIGQHLKPVSVEVS